MPINGKWYEECLCCQEFAPISGKKLKCITEQDGLGGIVLEISMYEFVERDWPLDDNESIYECWLHEHDANKTKA